MAEKSHENRLKEKQIELLAKGLEQQHISHLRADQSMLARKQPEPEQSGQEGPETRCLTTTTMTTSTAMETTSDLDTPGVSGTVAINFKIQ